MNVKILMQSVKSKFIAFIPLLLLSNLVAASEDQFEISGKVAGEVREPTVVLIDSKYGDIASTKIVNGEFYLTGSVDHADMAMLKIGGIYGIQMILDNSSYKVDWDEAGPRIDGGKLHEKVFGYRKQADFVAALKHSQEVDEKVFADLDMMDKEAVTQARKASSDATRKYLSIRNKYTNEILLNETNQLVRLIALMNHYDWDVYDMDKRLAMLDDFDKTLPGNPLVAQYRNQLDTMESDRKSKESVSVGKPYKEVIAKNEDGEVVKLSSVIGNNKLVLLDFWASWCGPCRGEFPHLKKAYEKYRDQGFEIYAVSIDEDRQDWLAATDEEQVPWINLLVDGGWENSAVKDYAVRGVPANFLIDSEGVIRHVDLREWKLDEVLEEVFKK